MRNTSVDLVINFHLKIGKFRQFFCLSVAFGNVPNSLLQEYDENIAIIDQGSRVTPIWKLQITFF